jgi:hypothetical protein
VKGIGSSAFSGCTSLMSINIPNSVTKIGSDAFYGCTSLTSINIPNSVTTIGSWAFSGCSSLTSINIPNSVINIDYWTFSNCTSLTSINIPNSVTNIGYGAFSGCTSLTSINIPNSVTNIGYSAFEGCSSLTSINIPNSVTSIGSSAFQNCTSLTSINIPNSVTNIGYSAFEGCSSLTSINIPNSVTSIGSSAFQNCTSLTSISIPNSVTNIGSWAFYYCTSLTSIIIPNSVTSIEGETFGGCTSLTSITIPNSVTTIGSSAFSNCRSLTSINIPNSVINIGADAFAYCINLSSITIPNSVTSIGYDAFADCTSLTIINIPNSVSKIGSHALDDTPWYYNQPNGLIYAGKVAYKYKGAMPANTKITLKDGTLGISDNAFWGCTGLTSITIPNSVTNIGARAFQGCTNLTSLVIPNSIKEIGYIAFYKTTSLTDIYCYATNPPDVIVGDITFLSSTCNVHIPIGTLSAYQNAEGWSDITNFIEDLSSTATYEPIEGSGDDLQDYLNSFEDTEDVLTTTTYTREFRNTVWQSFYVPFSLNYSDWSPYFEVAQPTGVSTTGKTQIEATLMTADNGNLLANTPYLIRAKKTGKYTFRFDTSQLTEKEENSKVLNKSFTIYGNYCKLENPNNRCMLGGSLQYINDNYVLPPYRWYVKDSRISVSAIPLYSPISIVVNNDVTGIEHMTISDDAQRQVGNETIYDLSGRRIAVSHLSELPKGVYIIDGKKLTIK